MLHSKKNFFEGGKNDCEKTNEINKKYEDVFREVAADIKKMSSSEIHKMRENLKQELEEFNELKFRFKIELILTFEIVSFLTISVLNSEYVKTLFYIVVVFFILNLLLKTFSKLKVLKVIIAFHKQELYIYENM